MENILFFAEDISFTLKEKTKIRDWIKKTIEDHQKKLKSINYIFTSDNYLSNINKDYLQHNTLTDIITFNQSAAPNLIESDIYISIDRILENSKCYNLPFTEELHRVMIHGILHLLGFNDKTEAEKKEMRKKENHYLALLL
jgi:probable rRNA maturation factor